MNQRDAIINSLAWPASRLDEAVRYLIQKSGISSAPRETPPLPDDHGLIDDEVLDNWIHFLGGRLDIEVEAVETSYTEVEHMVQNAGPAIIRLPSKEDHRFLAVLKGRGQWTQVIAPDLSVRRIRVEDVRSSLVSEIEESLIPGIERLIAEAGVSEQRRIKACNAILREQLGPKRIGGIWLLRMPPGANFWKQIRYARLPHYLGTMIGLHLAAQVFFVLNWWIIGKGVFQGHFEKVWIGAWILILLTGIPFQILRTWVGMLLSVRLGTLFKQRMLYGIVRLSAEDIRHQGIGQFLGRVMESEALDSMILGGGFTIIIAVTDLFIAGWILSKGLGAWVHTAVLAVWILITFSIAWRYYQHNREWVDVYQEMTNDLVERMVGHRTRLAQEDQHHWHDDEDRILERYLKLSEQLDQTGIHLNALISRGWMFVGLASVVWPAIAARESMTNLAISLGGIMLAGQALTLFVTGAMTIIGVKIAWEQAGPLFQAGAQTDPGLAGLSLKTDPYALDKDQPLMLIRDIMFRYREHGKPVLNECGLEIYNGNFLLLEGPSGGGKSTLASVAAGLRIPESGLILLGGFDRQTLGDLTWRKKVVTAPQFHENHVFTGTFSFNLLMGRNWPPTHEDLEEAEAICQELGLGDLIKRMPAGFQQMVGESGWQLSHGERSRLYIARALLQKAEIIILDESFAALDPENLHRSLQCVLNRAPTLLVIAHP